MLNNVLLACLLSQVRTTLTDVLTPTESNAVCGRIYVCHCLLCVACSASLVGSRGKSVRSGGSISSVTGWLSETARSQHVSRTVTSRCSGCSG